MTEIGEIIHLDGKPHRVTDKFPCKDQNGELLCYGLSVESLEPEPDVAQA